MVFASLLPRNSCVFTKNWVPTNHPPWMLELFSALVVLSVCVGFDGLSLSGYP